jgi:hypothetical protein
MTFSILSGTYSWISFLVLAIIFGNIGKLVSVNAIDTGLSEVSNLIYAFGFICFVVSMVKLFQRIRGAKTDNTKILKNEKITNVEYNRKIRNKTAIIWIINLIFYFFLSLQIYPEEFSDTKTALMIIDLAFGAILILVFLVALVGKFSHNIESAERVTTQTKKIHFTGNPWFIVSIILLLIIFFIAGRLTVGQQEPVQPKIIVQPAPQQAPVIIQQQPQRPIYQQTHCYWIGNNLNCSTY